MNFSTLAAWGGLVLRIRPPFPYPHFRRHPVPRPRTAVGAVLAALLICVLAACGKPPPILVGFSGPLEGTYSDLGVHGRNGALLAAEEINARNGVAGRLLKLMAVDDGTSAETAIAADMDLIRAGAVAIIGHMTSSQSSRALEAVTRADRILLSPTTSTPALSGKKDNFYRVMPASTVWAEGLADHAADSGRSQVLAFIDRENAAYSYSFTQAFSRRLTSQGGRVIEIIDFSSSGADWSSLVAQVEIQQPDWLLLVASARDSASLLRRLRSQGLPHPTLVAPWAHTPELIKAAGDAANGVISCLSFNDSGAPPAYHAFRQRYLDRFGYAPNFASAYGYEAMMVLGAALKHTKGEPEDLGEALLSLGEFPGILGPIVMDEYGDVRRPSFIIKVTDNEWETVRALPVSSQMDD